MPEEVRDEILSYLNVRDIKDASLVSKHWYNVIGKSKVCMEKLCLKLEDSNLECVTSILSSPRMYQNMNCECYSKIYRNTKYLRTIREIVTKFAESLVSMKTSYDFKINVDLPKLKELAYTTLWSDESLIAINGLLTKTKGLENLSVRSSHIDKKSMKYLRDFLMKNTTLKVLKIDNAQIIEGLNDNNLKFKLEEFHTQSNYGFYKSEGLTVNQDFFVAHSSSLNIAECALTGNDVAFFMSNFPKLHTLTVKCFQGYEGESPELPLNSTITNLLIKPHFYVHYHNLGQLIVELVRKLQNLRDIEIGCINLEILHALLNKRLLKTVKYYKQVGLLTQDLAEMARHENIEFIKINGNFY